MGQTIQCMCGTGPQLSGLYASEALDTLMEKKCPCTAVQRWEDFKCIVNAGMLQSTWLDSAQALQGRHSQFLSSSLQIGSQLARAVRYVTH